MDAVAASINELNSIAPAHELAETVTVTSIQRASDGRKVENKIEHVITPFTYPQFFRVLAHANKIFKSFESFHSDINFDDPMSLLRLVFHVSEHAGESVQELTALALGRPVEYLNTLMPDDGIKCTVATFRVNKDFFVQRVLPMMGLIQDQVQSMMNSGQEQ
jgi:hypothetical protein